MNAILSKELLKKIRTAAQIIFLPSGLFFLYSFFGKDTPRQFSTGKIGRSVMALWRFLTTR